MLAKVFKTREHQAYARRAKNDLIVAAIGGKFVTNDGSQEE